MKKIALNHAMVRWRFRKLILCLYKFNKVTLYKKHTSLPKLLWMVGSWLYCVFDDGGLGILISSRVETRNKIGCCWLLVRALPFRRLL